MVLSRLALYVCHVQMPESWHIMMLLRQDPTTGITTTITR